MNTLWLDLRYGARMLWKRPGFTAIAVAALALGIGANTALFSLIDKLLLRSLPVRDPGTLVQLTAETVNPKLTFRQFSWADFQAYRAGRTGLAELTAFKPVRANLGEGDQMERVRGELVAENYFALFGVAPQAGRFFLPEENRAPEEAPVAVLSYRLWQSRFGGAAGILGQTVTLNEHRYTVVGIAPASFHGVTVESPTDLWVPAMMLSRIERQKRNDEWLTAHDWAQWELLGRRQTGVTRQTAETAMDALAQQVFVSWVPESDRHLPFNERHVHLDDLAGGISSVRGEMGPGLLSLFAVVGVILLIACANLANLLLARASTRRREIAVRLALGAGRGRLIRQLLTESLLLAGLGGAAGVLLAPWLTQILLTFQHRVEDADIALALSLDWRVTGFAVAASLLTGVLFGLLPAVQASKSDLIPALKEEGAGRGEGRGFTWPRRALVVAQVALSLVVLVTAGLFVRTLYRMLAIDPGFQPAGVLAADIELPRESYDDARAAQFFRQLQERLQALPGVQSVSAAVFTPLSGNIGLTSVVIEGRPIANNDMQTVDMNTVDAGYHELMGIRLPRGRGFRPEDRKGQPEVAVVNEAFAQKFFPNEDPVGRRISLGTGRPWLTIVGVTRNLKSLTLDGEDRPQLELPMAQRDTPFSLRVLLRASIEPAALLPQMRREVRAMDASLSLFRATTLDADVRTQLATQRMAATLTSLFGLVALALTALGLYGVIAYAVGMRTREIGIRMALGAQLRDVLWLILREGLWLVGIGLVVGLALALAATRWIESMLYDVRRGDPLTFALVALLLLAVATLACYLPARRAMKVDPMDALRYE